LRLPEVVDEEDDDDDEDDDDEDDDDEDEDEEEEEEEEEQPTLPAVTPSAAEEVAAKRKAAAKTPVSEGPSAKKCARMHAHGSPSCLQLSPQCSGLRVVIVPRVHRPPVSCLHVSVADLADRATLPPCNC
jgi:hypothetical protein